MDAQQAAALTLVSVAGGTLARRVYQHLRGADGGSCPGCGECGREPRADLRPAPKSTPLVTLGFGAPPRRAKTPTSETR